jgi:hypothetical protein
MEAYIRTYTHMHPHFRCMHTVAHMAHVDRESWRRRLSGLGWNKRIRLARTPKWFVCMHTDRERYTQQRESERGKDRERERGRERERERETKTERENKGESHRERAQRSVYKEHLSKEHIYVKNSHVRNT